MSYSKISILIFPTSYSPKMQLFPTSYPITEKEFGDTPDYKTMGEMFTYFSHTVAVTVRQKYVVKFFLVVMHPNP